MNHANFTFYAELNDFIPQARRGTVIAHAFEGNPSVKHLMEALGVPHPEVQRILVNGTEVDFAYPVQNGDRVQVYPVSPPAPYPEQGNGNSLATARPRFVLDVHLGKLAAYLRMLGFDTLYGNDSPDDRLARIASQEERVLLTRDRGLLMRSAVVYGYCVRNADPHEQVVEVLRRYALFGMTQPFRRCLRCNASLEPVSKERIAERLEPLTRQYYDEFRLCPACDQIYWRGSHYRRMEQFIAGVLGQVGL